MEIVFHGVRGGILRPIKKYIFRNLIGITIEDGENKILLDAGTSKVIGDRKIKAILLSHTHIDHILHLKEIIKSLKFRVPIYTPQRLWLNKREAEQKTNIPERICGFKVDYIQTNHCKKNYCYKLRKDGKVICYTGDTHYFEELSDFCKNSDVLICEATHPNTYRKRSKIRGHMRPMDVIKLALEAKPKLLVLTHFNKLAPDIFLSYVKEKFPNAIASHERLRIKIS